MRRKIFCLLSLTVLIMFANGCDNLGAAKKGQIIDVTESNFEKVVLKNDKPVLVDFWAPWCGPCKSFLPTLEAMADKYQDKIVVVKINFDTEKKLVENYKVRSIPRLIYFKNGENIIDEGAMGSRELDKEIQSVIKLK